MKTLEACQALDAADPLARLRDLFSLRDGLIYLDGNSLGALPKATPSRIAEVVSAQWGSGLVGSWNQACWFDLPRRVGERIARLIGAGPAEVVAADSTSVNLYKVLSAALAIQRVDAPTRDTLLSERGNFPTDLYIADSLCRERGLRLRLVDADGIASALDDRIALLLLTHVNYRTGAMHDMAALTAAAHAAGALSVWDLAHSTGAVPVDLHACAADFAVGCGYKYLNGGPGAPAFVWAHPQHADRVAQPLAGWWGHVAPFEFRPGYRPAAGIARYLCGTPPILSLAALEAGLEVFEAADAVGGLAALRAKSLALGDLFIEQVEARCSGHGLQLASPREPGRRGSQVCFSRTDPRARGPESGAHAIVQALIARDVVGDFRVGESAPAPGTACAPDVLRFGLAPLYLRFEDVWNAVEQLREVLESDEWRSDRYHRRQQVT